MLWLPRCHQKYTQNCERNLKNNLGSDFQECSDSLWLWNFTSVQGNYSWWPGRPDMWAISARCRLCCLCLVFPKPRSSSYVVSTRGLLVAGVSPDQAGQCIPRLYCCLLTVHKHWDLFCSWWWFLTCLGTKTLLKDKILIWWHFTALKGRKEINPDVWDPVWGLVWSVYRVAVFSISPVISGWNRKATCPFQL